MCDLLGEGFAIPWWIPYFN